MSKTKPWHYKVTIKESTKPVLRISFKHDMDIDSAHVVAQKILGVLTDLNVEASISESKYLLSYETRWER